MEPNNCIYCSQLVIDNQKVCLSCEMKRDYVHIAKEIGLGGRERLKFVLYMNKRWRLSEIGEQSAKNWAKRFKNHTEYGCSDEAGKEILDMLKHI